MTNIICISALARPTWMLKKNGLWPVKKFTAIVILQLLFNITFDITTFSVISHNIIIAIRTNNMKLLSWMTCILFPLSNYFAKTIPQWFNRNNFFSIIEDLKSKVFNSHSEKLNRHIQTIDRISKLITRYFALAMTIFLSIFSIFPFFTNMTIMVPAPFDTGEFDYTYKLAHLFATTYLGINSASIDVFFMSLIALCRAQLDILEERLKNVLEDARELYECSGNKNMVDIIVQNILKECVILHDTINEFVKKLDSILSFPLFIQYISGCFVICNAILQLTILGESDSTTIIGLCGYSGIVFAQMSAYHWLGNEIIFKSNKIIESCYLSNWYKLDLKSQKHITLLMERAKRPLTVELYGLVHVSLDSLGVIVRWSYSVFALIKARYK